MFNLPIGDINFQKVREFCLEKRKEDLDLDYKSDWPSDLARIICGMANVQGGMVLIGINEIAGTRQPDWPPPGVVGTEDALHQRAVQVADDGIYPPVMPEIAVCPLDTDATHAVVVIRIEASRLLHATDGRRRVCVRVADQGRGYELADLSQLEWLFLQREKSVSLRHFILDRAAKRADNFVGHVAVRYEYEGGVLLRAPPFLSVYAVPAFPDQFREMTPWEMMRLGRLIKLARGLFDEDLVPKHPTWRTTSQGAFTGFSDPPRQYVELGARGLVYIEQELDPVRVELPSTPSLLFLSAPAIILYCKAFLVFASSVYKEVKWRGTVLLRADLRGVENIRLESNLSVRAEEPYRHHENYSQDDSVDLHQEEYRVEDLESAQGRILKQIGYALMWGFGYTDTRDELDSYFRGFRVT
jgi:hypothetical protein